MSTQESDGIAFSILPEETQRHFRLLELPPELLELLTQDDPPTLQFKSSNKSEGEIVVICTPDKTYNMRQVNTSNSVYVCQAYQPEGNDSDGYRQSALQGIAQTGFTLELDSAKGATAESYLRAALPIYSSTGGYQSQELKSKQQHFDDIPLSQTECEVAWRDLACFEPGDPPGCFIPSATAKLQAWRSILQQADASGVDLATPLMPKQLRLIVDENEEWSSELTRAVLASIFAPNGDGYAVAEQDRCVRIVGETVLAAMSEGRLLSLSGFEREWRDSLPEQWRTKAGLEILSKDCYRLDNDGKDVASVGHGTGDAAAAPAATEAKSTLGAKRKWHEKFRASKKT